MSHLEPVLVLGTGRSGTSTVARVLHERMGVLMGHHFRTPDEDNPLGYYEDLEFRDANHALLTGGIDAQHWRRAWESLLIRRRAAGAPWGLKDPRIAHVSHLMRNYVRFSRTVRTLRPIAQVVDSMRRCYGWSLEEARSLADTRERLINGLPPPVVTLDMACSPTDDDIVDALQEVTYG